MGAIAEAIIAYSQPLIDATDGSPDQMNRAFAISGACYNIGILPEALRAESIKSLQSALELSDSDFEDFCNAIVYPMLERFDEMFSNMGGGMTSGFEPEDSPSRAQPIPTADEPTAKSDEPLPYAPCPCNSGKKYKFCCKQSKSFAGAR